MPALNLPYTVRCSIVAIQVSLLTFPFYAKAEGQKFRMCASGKSKDQLNLSPPEGIFSRSLNRGVSSTMIEPALGPIPGCDSKASKDLAESKDSVWRTEGRNWSQEYENEYAEWIQKEVSTDFFEKFRIPTDCADAPTMLRAIFSRIKGLPFVVNDGRKFISQDNRQFRSQKTSGKWDSDWKAALLEDTRFRSFLDHLARTIMTSNLPLSTYPLRISEDGRKSRYLQPGVILLDNTHARFVHSLDPKKFFPLTEMAATKPRFVRPLNQSPTIEIGVDASLPGRGLVGWRWPVFCGGKKGWTLAPASAMPGFSLEQYQVPSDCTLSDYVADTVRDNDFDPSNDVEKLIESARSALVTRDEIVSNFMTLKNWNPGSPTVIEEDDFGTPSRDKRIIKRLKVLSDLQAQFPDQVGDAESLDKSLANAEFVVNLRKGESAWLNLYLVKKYGLSSAASLQAIDRWNVKKMWEDWNEFKEGKRDRKNEHILYKSLEKVFEKFQL